MEEQQKLEPWQIIIRDKRKELESRRTETIKFVRGPWDKKTADKLLVKIQGDAEGIDSLLESKPTLPVCTIDCKTDFERAVDDLFKVNESTEKKLRRHFGDYYHTTTTNTNARATIAASVFAAAALVSSKLAKMTAITPIVDALITLAAGVGCLAFLTSRQIKSRMTVMIDQRQNENLAYNHSSKTKRPKQNVYPLKPPGINL